MPVASGSLAYLGAARFQGYWDASTNNATGSGLSGGVSGLKEGLFVTGSSVGKGYAISSLSASVGDYWQVTGSGTHNVEGITNWRLNDWLIYSGSLAGAAGKWAKASYDDSIASIIMGDLSAPDIFHLTQDVDKQVLFITGSSTDDVIISGSHKFIYDYDADTLSVSGGAKLAIGTAEAQGCGLYITHNNPGYSWPKASAAGQLAASDHQFSAFNVTIRTDTDNQYGFAGIAFDVSTETDTDAIAAAIITVADNTTAELHDGNLVFATNDAADDGLTERMRITHDGNVGIGTLTPSTYLHISGAVSNGTPMIQVDQATANGEVLIANNNLGNASHKLLQSSDGSGDIQLLDGTGTATIIFDSSAKKMYLGDIGGEHISGDGTNLTLTSGADVIIAGRLSGSTANFNSNVFVFGDLGVTGSLSLAGPTTFSGHLSGTTSYMSGDSWVFGDLGVTGSVNAGALSGSSTLNVAGASTFGPADYASISAAGVISGSGDSTIHKVTVNQLVAATADINGGSVDGATIGANSQSSVKATTISGSGAMNIAGASTFGPADYASISAAGVISGSGDSTIHKVTMNQLVAGTAQIDAGQLTGSIGILVKDDKHLTLGDDADTHIRFDTADNALHISGSKTGGVAISGSQLVMVSNHAPSGDVRPSIGQGDIFISGSDDIRILADDDITISWYEAGSTVGADRIQFKGSNAKGAYVEIHDETTVYVSGTLNTTVISGSGDSTIHKITMNQLVAGTADINGGSVDGTTLGANSQSSVKATTISGSGAMNIVGASTFGPSDYASISADGVLSGSAAATLYGVTTHGVAATSATITPGTAGGDALTITHTDVDKHAVKIAATNLTTGNSLFIDHNDSATTAVTPSSVVVDFDKTGVVGDGVTSAYAAMNIDMDDAATNHANSTVTLTGLDLDIVSANAQGVLSNVGLDVTCTGADDNWAAKFTATNGALISYEAGKQLVVKANSSGNGFISGSGGTTFISNGLGHRAHALPTQADGTNLSADSSGAVIMQSTNAAVLNLPQASPAIRGCKFTFIGAGAGLAFDISPHSSDKIYGSILDVNAVATVVSHGTNAAGVDDKDLKLDSGSKAGDRVTLICDGLDGWVIAEGLGSWVFES